MITTIEILSDTPSYQPFRTMMQTTLPITIVTQRIESALRMMFFVAISRTIKLKVRAMPIPDIAL